MSFMTPTHGLCHCGCGSKTKIAPRTYTARGWVKGEPQPYLRGHAAWKDRGPRWIEGPIPVDRPDLGPCWIWQRSFYETGYPQGSFKRFGGAHSQMAHRGVYEELVGVIPEGLELDHLCFVPACVRPSHMEPVTPEENLRRRRTTNQKLYNPELQVALELRKQGMRWRSIAAHLDCTHGPLITRLKKFCEINNIPYPASDSTRPELSGPLAKKFKRSMSA